MNRSGATGNAVRWSLPGNLLIASILLGLVVASLFWQQGSLVVQSPGPSRILWAIGSTAAYAGSCLVLFLVRRSRARKIKATEPATGKHASTETVLVIYASQTGFAERLAAQTAESLSRADTPVVVRSLHELDPATLQSARRALFVVSTTGEGDAPDMAAGFVSEVMGSGIDLGELHYGVLALGDSDYSNFCAFGESLDTWLRNAGAHPLFDLIRVDDGDAGAVRHWQYHLGQMSGRSDLPDWQTPEYSRWKLVDRRVLNPGSAGDPCFHVALCPVDIEGPHWQAGDIAEVGPQNAPGDVESWLKRQELDGDARVSINGAATSLRRIAACSSLEAGIIEGSPQQVADSLAPLPHRDYSIASIPADGRIELLLRQWRRSDGTLGLGTGWLTESAQVGSEIRLRIRINNSFHAPSEDCPLLLVGNGTGMASLRALIKQREVENRNRNWLVFGERNADRDFHYRDEILAWKKRGTIDRLDLAFSRDQADRIYVQHRLEAAADRVREWVSQGAVIMVCGSQEGMAPGVDDALRRILGNQQVQDLIRSSRYRRDVY